MVERFEFTCPDCDPDKVSVNHGRYVRYSDYAALEAQLAEAMKVKQLEWEEIHQRRSDEDPSTEWNGGYEADSALGYYEISMGFGSDAYYWTVSDPLSNDIGSDFEDPSDAKAAAQADYERRIRSALEPAAPEGQQEAVAGIVPAHCTGSSLVFTDGILHVNKDGSGHIVVKEADFCIETEYDYDGARSDFWITRFPPGEMQSLKDFLNGVPLSRPAEQAVTEEMVEAAVRAVKYHLYNNGDGKASFIRECDIRAAIRAALKAAMEAGRHD